MYLKDLNLDIDDDALDYVTENMDHYEEYLVFENHLRKIEPEVKVLGYSFDPGDTLFTMDCRIYKEELDKYFKETEDWINDGYDRVYDANEFFQLLGHYDESKHTPEDK